MHFIQWDDRDIKLDHNGKFPGRLRLELLAISSVNSTIITIDYGFPHIWGTPTLDAYSCRALAVFGVYALQYTVGLYVCYVSVLPRNLVIRY